MTTNASPELFNLSPKRARTEDTILKLVSVLPEPGPDAPDSNAPSTPRATKAGTPCARSWDAAWIAAVEDAETRLGHAICGARTIDGTPCEIQSNHPNGRCRFHGGFDLTGAPKGNRNAIIHGLYSRRLRVCGPDCPQWSQCPCAGNDIANLNPVKRPTCPYEQTEYNTALTDALARAATNPNSDPMALHIAHNAALLQVMINRTAVAMRNAPVVDESTQKHQKPSAAVQAFLRISSEYRRYAQMLQPKKPIEPTHDDIGERNRQTNVDTSLDPDHARHMRLQESIAQDRAWRHLRDAVYDAEERDDLSLTDNCRQAYNLAPKLTQRFYQKLNAPEGELSKLEKRLRDALKYTTKNKM